MSTMLRVSKANLCPACKKPDWCLYGKDAFLCMRIPSTKPHTLSDGSVGWIHSMNGKPLPIPEKKEKQKKFINIEFTLLTWARQAQHRSLNVLAHKLSVSTDSLAALGCVPAPYSNTWAFPMRDGNNTLVGIRLRHESGKKWAVEGSHQGLFIPQCEANKDLVILEGPTDTAAALTIGLYCIGRPNCVGGVFDIKAAIKRLKIRRVTIVADCDVDKVHKDTKVVTNPGISGASSLSQQLEIPSRIVTLPAKDMRDFVSKGGTAALFNAIASQLVWNMPT